MITKIIFKRTMPEINPITPDYVVDAGGLNCPLPILKARKALMDMTSGQILQVIASDPTSADDFPVFAQATGNTLLKTEQVNGLFNYYLCVGD